VGLAFGAFYLLHLVRGLGAMAEYADMPWVQAMGAELGWRPVALLAALGVSVGLGSGFGGGQLWADAVRFTGLTLSLVPAVWVVVGAAVLAQGLVPRVSTAVGWTVLGTGIVTLTALAAALLVGGLWALRRRDLPA
jgi:ABC-2 type transport system permease protein